jgi:hypothetical protein
MEFEFIGCKLNASLTGFWEETKEHLNHRIKVANSSSTSAGAEYQYHEGGYGGEVDEDTSIYRDGSTAFPSATKISLKCVTNADATPASPFWFDFPTRYAKLSDATSDQITVYLYTDTQLYDSDVWIEAVYPDDTTKQLYNYQSTRHTDIMDTNGTELTTNTEAWTGTAKTYKYQVTMDTAAGGSDCYPIIRCYVAKASITIYFDSEVVLSG